MYLFVFTVDRPHCVVRIQFCTAICSGTHIVYVFDDQIRKYDFTLRGNTPGRSYEAIDMFDVLYVYLLVLSYYRSHFVGRPNETLLVIGGAVTTDSSGWSI